MLLGKGGVLKEGSSGSAGGGGGSQRKRLSQGEGSPREGLTSSILIHHAQPLCLVLSLEGIEVQDAKGKKGKMEEMY